MTVRIHTLVAVEIFLAVSAAAPLTAQTQWQVTKTLDIGGEGSWITSR
jgi:hypothetical protein